MFVVRSGSTDYSYDTGVAVDTLWHTLSIRSVSAGTVLLKLDGGTERSACPSGCDLTVTLPSGGFAACALVVTNTSATKDLELDFFAFQARVSTGAERQ
jgi:hypothetical protein